VGGTKDGMSIHCARQQQSTRLLITMDKMKKPRKAKELEAVSKEIRELEAAIKEAEQAIANADKAWAEWDKRLKDAGYPYVS